MKINIFFNIVVLILTLSVTLQAQQPNWYIKLKQVKSLESSRDDVEKIFNDAKVTKAFVSKGLEYVFYETPEGDLFLKYSIGNCSTEDALFDVDKGKVIQAMFEPSVRGIKLSKFKINKSSFYIKKEDDNPGLHYINDNLGIDFGTQNEKVYYVVLFPSSKFNNLKCGNLNKE